MFCGRKHAKDDLYADGSYEVVLFPIRPCLGPDTRDRLKNSLMICACSAGVFAESTPPLTRCGDSHFFNPLLVTTTPCHRPSS